MLFVVLGLKRSLVGKTPDSCRKSALATKIRHKLNTLSDSEYRSVVPRVRLQFPRYTNKKNRLNLGALLHHAFHRLICIISVSVSLPSNFVCAIFCAFHLWKRFCVTLITCFRTMIIALAIEVNQLEQKKYLKT